MTCSCSVLLVLPHHASHLPGFVEVQQEKSVKYNVAHHFRHHPEFCVKTGRRQPGEDARLMGPYPKARTNRKMQLGLAKILSKQASKGALVTQDGAQTTPLSDPAFLAGCLYVDDDQYAAFSQPESLAGGYLASQPKR